jgi:hypothetical protein
MLLLPLLLLPLLLPLLLLLLKILLLPLLIPILLQSMSYLCYLPPNRNFLPKFRGLSLRSRARRVCPMVCIILWLTSPRACSA